MFYNYQVDIIFVSEFKVVFKEKLSLLEIIKPYWKLMNTY